MFYTLFIIQTSIIHYITLFWLTRFRFMSRLAEESRIYCFVVTFTLKQLYIYIYLNWYGWKLFSIQVSKDSGRGTRTQRHMEMEAFIKTDSVNLKQMLHNCCLFLINAQFNLEMNPEYRKIKTRRKLNSILSIDSVQRS